MDRDIWHATVHGVTKSQTRLSDWTELKWTELNKCLKIKKKKKLTKKKKKLMELCWNIQNQSDYLQKKKKNVNLQIWSRVMILNLENNWIMCSQLKDRNVCHILKILHLNMHLSWIQSYSSLNLNNSKESRKAFLRAQSVKNLPTRQETPVRFLGWEDPLEKEMSTHASILAWRIPRTEEPGRQVSRGSQESDTS